jgi:hypothetical protein
VQLSDGRRELQCDSTWAGFQTLPSELVDFLVTQCDGFSTRDSSALESLHPVEYNPFRTFAITLPHRLQTEEKTDLEPPEVDLDAFGLEPDSADLALDFAGLVMSLADRIPHALGAFPDATPDERSLFHHYVSHVAVIMMPYEHARNPWKLHYPAVAHGRTFPDQTALYHAMLSQAAFNISNLRAGDHAMTVTGFRHYAAAIRQLVLVIGEKMNDFGSLLASILTLVFAETYSGESRQWRYHFQGAWQLFNQYRACEPWKITDFVCVSIQSLNIVKVISETSDVVESRGAHETVRGDETSSALGPILSTFDFGFTIGASPATLRCIAAITEFRKAGEPFGAGSAQAFLEETLAQLNTCLRDVGSTQLDKTNGEDEATERCSSQAQRISFVYATYIYLYRTVLHVPPQTVANYVSSTFDNVSTFYACNQGNFSIWPAFMAAVEATADADIASAREWLDWATSFGLGNRVSVRRVVEEVWKRRETHSRLFGMARGMVAIEWRDVVQELDCDVLLL